LAIGDQFYHYDELRFDLAVGGQAWPEASSDPYQVPFKPIKYDKEKLIVKQIRIESVVNQDYAGSSKYEAYFKIKDGANIIVTMSNTATWSFTDVAQTKTVGRTTAINDNGNYSIEGTATYHCIPGVAPFTTARCHVNLRVYYVLEQVAEGAVEQPTSGGGGTVIPPVNTTAMLGTIVLIGGLAVAGVFGLSLLGKEFRPERERAGKAYDDFKAGGGSITKELKGLGSNLKGLLKGKA
jgi:hypothetical protein